MSAQLIITGGPEPSRRQVQENDCVHGYRGFA